MGGSGSVDLSVVAPQPSRPAPSLSPSTALPKKPRIQLLPAPQLSYPTHAKTPNFLVNLGLNISDNMERRGGRPAQLAVPSSPGVGAGSDSPSGF